MTNSTTPTKPETSSVKKRIIKTGTCPSLSRLSTLTYHIGCDDKEAIYFQLVSNSNNGFFNDDWIALTDIQSTFENWPVDISITSFTLQSLFEKRSANSPAFLLAALKEEGIVATLKGKRRNHEHLEPSEFIDDMNKLIKSGVSLYSEVDTNSKPKKGNTSTAKKTAPRSKPQLKSA
jgi:hypothetical protein